MPFAMRHRDDPMPTLAPLAGLEVHRAWDAEFMATLQGRSEASIAERFATGHRAYVAWVDEVAAAWGWVATRTATIGEMDTTFTIPAGERYLWNFATLASHRGRGVYPRLLQAIVRAESAEASRFWIAHAPENHASATGIRKAGFATLAALSFDAAGRPALRATGTVGDPGAPGASTVASLLGLPATRAALTPCWRCVRAGRGAMACVEGHCGCDYQVPAGACDAGTGRHTHS